MNTRLAARQLAPRRAGFCGTRPVAAALVFVVAALALVGAGARLGPLSTAEAAPAPASLTIGSKGPAVSWLQLRLTALRVYSGPITGYFGTQTQAGVRAFQRSKGIAVSGVVGPVTASALSKLAWQTEIGKGETLEGIAARMQCGVAELLGANPQVVNPNRIYAGQKLMVPVPREILALASGGGVSGDGSVPAMSTAPVQVSVPVTQPQPGTTPAPEPGSVPARPQPAVVSPLRVALTFNDGPDPTVLPAILEILQRHSVPATFFFSGREMSEHRDLVREVFRLGHPVESHGWRHEPLAGLTEARISAELTDNSRLIAELTGRRPAFLRPPGGIVDQVVFSAAARAGQRIIWWHNIGTLPENDSTVSRLDRYMFDGAIILLPAADPRTPVYLDAFLRRWIGQGASFCRLANTSDMTWGW